tara:strand:- start:352 stop:687 length:336 start_codon:yes stop_codon:yes gene_type:complete
MSIIEFKIWNGEKMIYDEKEMLLYTGINDMKGKRIYEGDLIQYQSFCDGIEPEIKTAIIKFEKGCFYPLTESNGNSSGVLYTTGITNIKIISSIKQQGEENEQRERNKERK